MKYLHALLLLSCSVGCTGTETLRVKSIYGNSMCGDSVTSMRFIQATQFPALTVQNGLRRTWEESPALPPISNDERLLLISLGQKPSGGYALVLTAETATVTQGVVMLPVQIEEPASDSLQTQQLTQPCLLVSLPRGNYRQVRSSALQGLTAPAD